MDKGRHTFAEDAVEMSEKGLKNRIKEILIQEGLENLFDSEIDGLSGGELIGRLERLFSSLAGASIELMKKQKELRKGRKTLLQRSKILTEEVDELKKKCQNSKILHEYGAQKKVQNKAHSIGSYDPSPYPLEDHNVRDNPEELGSSSHQTLSQKSQEELNLNKQLQQVRKTKLELTNYLESQESDLLFLHEKLQNLTASEYKSKENLDRLLESRTKGKLIYMRHYRNLHTQRTDSTQIISDIALQESQLCQRRQELLRMQEEKQWLETLLEVKQSDLNCENHFNLLHSAFKEQAAHEAENGEKGSKQISKVMRLEVIFKQAYKDLLEERKKLLANFVSQ